MMPATNAIHETLMTPRANSDAINQQHPTHQAPFFAPIRTRRSGHPVTNPVIADGIPAGRGRRGWHGADLGAPWLDLCDQATGWPSRRIVVTRIPTLRATNALT